MTGIGDCCFSGNVWLERVSVPEGIVKIGDYAFECCGLLERAYLPESLISIGNGAFSGCGKLILADISDSTASIGDGAFMACGKYHVDKSKTDKNRCKVVSISAPLVYNIGIRRKKTCI